MVRDVRMSGGPTLQAVLDALDDPDCRAIIRAIDEPMTASEISDATDIPSSTVYRKLDLLDEAGLVAASTRIRPDGHHASVYKADFDAVVVSRSDDGLIAQVARESQSPDERLADLWQEVGREL